MSTTPVPTPQPLNPTPQEHPVAYRTRATAFDRGTRSATTWLTFWIPIALIVTAVIVSHTSLRHASVEGDESIEVDVVEAGEGSNLGRRLIFPALALAGLVLLWQSRGQALGIHRLLATTSAALLLLVGASVLWSVEPDLTLRRALVVFFVAIAAIGIGRAWTAIDLCRAALIMSSLFVGLSLLFELQGGSFLQGAEYRFSGLFHPNRQAVNTGILTLSSLCLFRQSRQYRYLALVILGIVLTKLTGSRGCLLALFFAIACTYWITISNTARMWSIIACGMCVSIGLILFSLSDAPVPDVTEVARMGRTDALDSQDILNGRFAIWHDCIADIGARPLVGYGYGAFWTPDRVFEYSRILNWAFASAHSVYFETALDIGIVGVSLALAVALMSCVMSLRAFRQTRDWGMMFIFSLICMGLVSGLVDVMFVQIGFATTLLAIGVAILTVKPLPQPATRTRKGVLA